MGSIPALLATLVKKGLMDGPLVCKTRSQTENVPDEFLCSRPSVTDLLKINVLPAELAAIMVQLCMSCNNSVVGQIMKPIYSMRIFQVSI